MTAASRFVAAVLISHVVFSAALRADDWPAFRGPRGGIADDSDLPVRWTKENFLWKVKLPGPGSSSPITCGDKIFVTSYTGYGLTLTRGFGKTKTAKDKGKANPGDQEKLRLLLLCMDRKDGQIHWQKEVQPKLPEMAFRDFIREHGYASSTPATDGQRVYVFFGKTGVLAFDLNGKQLWQADVGSGTDKWGSASSPVVTKNLVIVNAAIESDSLVALDKKTGKEVWRVKGMGSTWSSPGLVETQAGKQEVVLSLVGRVVAYDPQSGQELWHCQGIGAGPWAYTCSSPVARDGIVYVIGGGGPIARATALAVKAGGKGDVNKTHVLWRKNAGTGISSPVLSGEHLCWVSGTAMCLNTGDGKVAYQERLYSSFGEYVSAVAAGDKIFALTRFDGMFVLAGGGKFNNLAHNDFPGDDSIFNASPAVSNGRLYIRSNEYLYCIGKK
jgi:outer membrane protein assembly factor BamB